MCCVPRLPLLPQLLQSVVVVVVVVVVPPGEGGPVGDVASWTSTPYHQLDVEDHPGPWASHIPLASTSPTGQVLTAGSGGEASHSSQEQSGDNSTMPTAQPLIQKWNRVQHLYPRRPITQHQLSNSRKDYLLRTYQSLLRSPQRPLRQSPTSRRHSANTQSQDTKSEHSYPQSRKNNLGNNLPAQHRQDTFDVGFRSPSGVVPSQVYGPQGTPRHVPRPDPFSRSQQFPRQPPSRANVKQKIYRQLPDEQSERDLKEPGPEISVHDLTSAFYKALEFLPTFPNLQTSASHNTDEAVPSTNSPRSFNNNNRPSVNLQYDSALPRAPPEYPTRHRGTPPHAPLRVYDPDRYPPSVAYGEPYFDQYRPPPRIDQNLQEADHSGRRNTYLTPTSYNRNGQHRPQSPPGNMYNSDPNRRQFLVHHYLASQNYEDPIYRNQKLNSRQTTTRLNYAKLPSGYESPTTTFEELINNRKGERTNNARRKKITFEMKKHQPSVQVNGHGRPHFIQ